MPRVQLGFGANLGDPRATLDRAIEALAAERIALVRRAPLFRTAPMGPPGQPDYLNTVLPAGQTDILVSYTYRIAFRDSGQDFGLAAAISTVIFFMVALMSMANLRLLRNSQK